MQVQSGLIALRSMDWKMAYKFVMDARSFDSCSL
jgi:hypothetical protein